MAAPQKNNEYSFASVDRVVPIIGAPEWHAARPAPSQGFSR